MPYSAKAVANAILNKAAEDGRKITHLKLQKLLYYVAGYYLVATGKPLIDHTFEAWEYGPVVPEIYHEFKANAGKPITTQATELDWETGQFVPVPIPTDDRALNKVLDFVMKNYGKYSGAQLSDMTHREGSPWDLTRQANPGMRGVDIPLERLKEHFAPLVRKKVAHE
ncbi:Panacea domain-containing protein [Rhizobium giardinii]|uniref:Panacea domain-containing protein n=1 Tax=Rhizobium giardinii TaxID=56731 RepID=UPI003D6FC02D